MTPLGNNRNTAFSESELRAVERSVFGGRRVLWAGVLAVVLPLAIGALPRCFRCLIRVKETNKPGTTDPWQACQRQPVFRLGRYTVPRLRQFDRR